MSSSFLRKFHASHFVALVLLALVVLSSAALMAQGPKPPAKEAPKAAPALPPPATTHEMTAADVGAFLDGVMPMQLAREDVAGAVVSVVKDGKVLFAKGYGYSDVAKRTPVSPDNTLFRPGSISKLFTWTAVMQQVELGKLDLDRDVNDYLDFKIPATFPKPITLRDIMTHTAGFEETVQELFVRDAKGLTPLPEYLKAHLPARIFPPFTTPAYSNYATAMAGYIVQRVSGEDFDSYIETHILKPLGMTHSTFRQPLPDDLKGLMSNGYRVASQPPRPFEFVNTEPAGSSSVSAMDMTRFMRAHLQDGQFEGAQILRPETARLMHTRQFANLPDMNAMALGFYEETRNGHRIIGHAGDTECFHSDMHLIPDANVGFFISYNSGGKGEISPRTAVWEAFLDRYFPLDDPPAAATAAASPQDVNDLPGHYIVSRRGEKTLMKMLGAISQTKVVRNADGTLSVDAMKDLNGQPKKFKEIAALRYQDVNGQDRIGFKRDDSGRMVMVIDYPFMVFQKAAWYENGGLHVPLIILSLTILVLTLVLWPVEAMMRRHYDKKLELTPVQRRLRLLVRLVCGLDLLFLLGFLIFFTLAMKDIGMFSPRSNGWLRLIQLVGWLGVVGTLVAIYYALRSWMTSGRWFWTKLADTAIALACVGFAWFVFTWNMLHWGLRY